MTSGLFFKFISAKLTLSVISSGGHSPKSRNLFLSKSDLSTPVHRTSGRDDKVMVFLRIVIFFIADGLNIGTICVTIGLKCGR